MIVIELTADISDQLLNVLRKDINKLWKEIVKHQKLGLISDAGRTKWDDRINETLRLLPSMNEAQVKMSQEWAAAMYHDFYRRRLDYLARKGLRDRLETIIRKAKRQPEREELEKTLAAFEKVSEAQQWLSQLNAGPRHKAWSKVEHRAFVATLKPATPATQPEPCVASTEDPRKCRLAYHQARASETKSPVARYCYEKGLAAGDYRTQLRLFKEAVHREAQHVR